MVNTKKKPYDSEWTPRETQILSRLDGYIDGEDSPKGRYGGLLETQFEATGFFRTQKIDGRWWLVDPDGHLFIHVGLNSVGGGWSDHTKARFEELFDGSYTTWAQHTMDFLHTLHFNGTGAWSTSRLQRASTPPVYTNYFHVSSSFGERFGAYHGSGNYKYPDDVAFVFHPDFEAFADEYIREEVEDYADDPWCLGHFSDNEMPFPSDALDRLWESEDWRGDERQYAQKWLRGRKGIESVSLDDITDDDREAFLRHYADTYYGVVKKMLNKYAPNQLYLGSRSNKYKKPIIEGAGRHCDVLSINWYSTWTPDQQEMDNWMEWGADKPFLITEWYSKGMDVTDTTLLTNESGAGWTVETQTDRGYFYQNFTLGLLKHPGCVGWHYFKYIDNDPLDTSVDPSNTNSNKGIMTIDFEPYTELTEAMREINKQAFSLISFFGNMPLPKGTVSASIDITTPCKAVKNKKNSISIYPYGRVPRNIPSYTVQGRLVPGRDSGDSRRSRGGKNAAAVLIRRYVTGAP